MSSAHEVLRGDEWRDALAVNFNGLIPDYRRTAEGWSDDPGRSAAGWLRQAQLGFVTAFHVSGADQVLRRSPALARRRPSELLKVCIQRAGQATIQQGDREAVLTPGSMAIYDIDKPYAIRLRGTWRCAVIAFPRSALLASEHFIDAVSCRPTPVTSGPGSVLAPLI